MTGSKLGVIRRRPVLVTIIALAGAAVAAAAGIRAYQTMHFTATLQLDDGSTAQVQGEVEVVGEGENSQVNVSADVTGSPTANGQMTVTLPDGRQVKVIAAPRNGGKPAGAAPNTPAK